jgi:hypothetical protein
VLHQPIAAKLRASPNSWAKVDNYRWMESAKSIVYCITRGRLTAYQPVGQFEAEIRIGSDGDPIVYARFVGPRRR